MVVLIGGEDQALAWFWQQCRDGLRAVVVRGIPYAGEVAQANALACAVNASMKTNLLGKAATLEYHVAVLEHNRDLLPEMAILLLDAQHSPALVEKLGNTRYPVFAHFTHLDAVPQEILQARPQIQRLPSQEISSAAVRLESPEKQLRHSIARREWLQAIVLLSEHPDLLEPFLDTIGWGVQEDGLLEEAFGLLRSLPEPYSRRPSVLRWSLALAIDLGRQEELLETVQEVLRRTPDGKLGAFYALALHSMGNSRSLEVAEHALSLDRSPEVLSVVGYILQAKDTYKASLLLNEALEKAEAQGLSLVQGEAALGLSQCALLDGQLGRARQWLRWAARLLENGKINNTSLRLRVLNEESHLRVLTGDLAGLEDQLRAEVHYSQGYSPRIRNLLSSTLAELLIVQGRLEEAQEILLELWARIKQRNSYAMYAQPTVTCLLGLGNEALARKLAVEALTLNIHSFGTYALQAEIAVWMCQWTHSPAEAAPRLRAIAEQLEAANLVPYAVPARCLEAACWWRLGDDVAAKFALSRVRNFLLEVDSSSMVLLGGPECARTIQEQWRKDTDELHLHFLGQSKVWFRNRLLPVTGKGLDVLAALSLNQEGLSSRGLTDAVYGEDAPEERTRSLVAHLRRLLPIEHKPYRLPFHVEADFLTVQKLLDQHQTRKAIGLYQGPLLPESSAPLVEAERYRLETALTRAALELRDGEALLHLASRTRDDLNLWILAVEYLGTHDPRRALAQARRDQLAHELGIELSSTSTASPITAGGQGQLGEGKQKRYQN